MKLMRERLEIFKEIFPYVSKYKVWWVLLLCLKVGQRLPVLLQPLILRTFIIYVIDDRNISYMLSVIAMYMGLYLVDTILKVLHRVIDNSLFNKITGDLRRILFEHYIYMPKEKYNTYEVNDLVRRLNFDVDMVKFFLVGQVFDHISYIVLIIVSTVLMLSLEWHLALIAYILMPLSIWLSKKYEDKIEKNAEQNRKLITQIEERVEKISAFWKEVKANQLETYQEKDFGYVLDSFLKCMYENTEITFRRKSALDIKESIVDLMCMYAAGGILALFYHIAAGTVIACVGYYHNILEGSREIMEINASLNWMKPSISRVIEIANLPLEKYDNSRRPNAFDRSIYVVDHIWFGYRDFKKEIIQDLSFEIEEGEKVLIEGASGSGKSTLMQLLTGELMPTEGEVIFKGLDLARFSSRELYDSIRIIDQNTYYMNISVREFLKMAKQNAGDDEMKQVCLAVNLWEDLEAKNEELEVLIGENGSNLSKGQKQKLALARLLLNKNKIIMLDEAFSAIDASDKAAIIDIILKHFKEETIICIAHDEEIKRRFCKTIEVGKEVFILDDRNLFQRNRKHKILRGEISRSI